MPRPESSAAPPNPAELRPARPNAARRMPRTTQGGRIRRGKIRLGRGAAVRRTGTPAPQMPPKRNFRISMERRHSWAETRSGTPPPQRRKERRKPPAHFRLLHRRQMEFRSHRRRFKSLLRPSPKRQNNRRAAVPRGLFRRGDNERERLKLRGGICPDAENARRARGGPRAAGRQKCAAATAGGPAELQ